MEGEGSTPEEGDNIEDHKIDISCNNVSSYHAWKKKE